MKITMVYDNGLDTSLMMEMSVKDILKNLPVNIDIDHVDLGFAKGTPGDIYTGTKNIAEQLVMQSVAGRVAAPENMIDEKTMRERSSVVLTKLGAL